MAIARRVTTRRMLGTGAATLALCAASVAAASGAWAHGDAHGGNGWKSGGHYSPGTGAGTRTGTDRCEFSLDGSHFFASVKVDDQNLKPTADGKVHITVRAAGDAAGCTASLASYQTHGASFASSGEQVFVDFDTVAVKPGRTDTLDIAVPDAGCFAQIDLYRGAVKYDGKLDASDGFEHGELPKGPDRAVIKDKLIAAWNGGTKDCTAVQSPSPSPSAPASTEPSSPSGETSAPATTAPATQSPSESAAPSQAPSAVASTTAPAAGTTGGDSGSTGGDLAETGGGGNSGIIGAGAAALVVAGGAIVFATKRRKAATRG